MATETKPRINIWICYGGGLVVGVVAWLMANNWWVAIGAVVGWFIFYTFTAATRQDRVTATRDAARRATEAAVSRQVRRAAERRADKRQG